MIIKIDEDGSYIEAKVLLTVRAYVSDDITEVSDEEAIDLIQERLGYLAGSNDGSELLGNVPNSDIILQET